MPIRILIIGGPHDGRYFFASEPCAQITLIHTDRLTMPPMPPRLRDLDVEAPQAQYTTYPVEGWHAGDGGRIWVAIHGLSRAEAIERLIEAYHEKKCPDDTASNDR